LQPVYWLHGWPTRRADPPVVGLPAPSGAGIFLTD